MTRKAFENILISLFSIKKSKVNLSAVSAFIWTRYPDSPVESYFWILKKKPEMSDLSLVCFQPLCLDSGLCRLRLYLHLHCGDSVKGKYCLQLNEITQAGPPLAL